MHKYAQGALTVTVIVAGLFLAGSDALSAAQYEFLFTSDKAICLANGAEIVPGTKFEEQSLRAKLPGYEFESAQEEGQDYVYARKNSDGVGQGGVAIAIGTGNVIDFVSGGDGVIDSAGATAGMSLTKIYKSRRAKCTNELDFECESEISPAISYTVDIDQCDDSVIPDYRQYKGLTKLDPCMKVYSISVSAHRDVTDMRELR